MKTVAIIQARMGSSRLPGKSLLPLHGKPVLAHALARLKRCRMIDHIIVATTTEERDRVLLDLARKEGVEGFAGSESDVLDRYYQAARSHTPDHVIRCTGDCPILDPKVTDDVVQRHLEERNDYTSNTIRRTYPRGYDTEVMTFASLERAAREARADYEREHVTPYIWEHPALFKLGHVLASPDRTQPDLRVTVDTQEDFDLIESIFDALYPTDPLFGVDAVMELIRKQPELKSINAHIEQKKLPQK
ncbi:MAG: glycosyltransferase family protein [Candidatus Omnitrophota bacterium]